jgi:Pathogenicity locus
MDKATAIKELQRIPSIGKACAEDLWQIGIRKISDLNGKRPEKLYVKLNQTTGVIHDVCMLYTFRCAVYFASNTKHDPKKLRWWYWKDKDL